MGILNVTPDSFSDGGRFDSVKRAIDRAHEIARAGASILDLGGESTRPGSDPVEIEEELARVVPLLDALAGNFPLPISIDTRRARVAEAAAERGATILNDTAALRDDPEIADVAREREMTVVLMHRRGTPRTMQIDLDRGARAYGDVVAEVREFFLERVEAALAAGIPREKLILDPGIGFGKRPEDNDRLIAGLDALRIEGIPLLVGASRKKFLERFSVGAASEAAPASDRLPLSDRLSASLAVAAACARHRVETIRVHDVAETVSFLRALEVFEGDAPC